MILNRKERFNVNAKFLRKGINNVKLSDEFTHSIKNQFNILFTIKCRLLSNFERN